MDVGLNSSKMKPSSCSHKIVFENKQQQTKDNNKNTRTVVNYEDRSPYCSLCFAGNSGFRPKPSK
jgi:hypothetical protein